jgi:hypothetical protein
MDQPPTVVQFATNLSVWPQLGPDILMAKRETTHLVHDLLGLVIVSVFLHTCRISFTGFRSHYVIVVSILLSLAIDIETYWFSLLGA